MEHVRRRISLDVAENTRRTLVGSTGAYLRDDIRVCLLENPITVIAGYDVLLGEIASLTELLHATRLHNVATKKYRELPR